jgi:hypothetical protein
MRTARAVAEHGDAKLTELLVTLANCPRGSFASVCDRCKAVYERPAVRSRPPSSLPYQWPGHDLDSAEALAAIATTLTKDLEAERRTDGKGGYFITMPHNVLNTLNYLAAPARATAT